MAAIDRLLKAWRAPLIIGPVMLGLGGCVAAPLVGAMTSGAGNAGMLSAVQTFLPGPAAGHAAPCAAGATSGCAAGGTQAARPATEVAQAPAAAPGGSATSPCDPSQSGSGSANCDSGTMDSVMHTLTGSLQNLVRGTGLSN